ncbi:MAG: CocE/NonD family hydrolase [Bacillota bacterium]
MGKLIGCFLVSLICIAVFLPGVTLSQNQPDKKVSSLSNYSGYSSMIYNKWQRSSLYVQVRDGTKLAVDIYRPVDKGKVVNDPLPVIWMHTCYQRVMTYSFFNIDLLKQFPHLKTLIQHGYVLASVDVRGTVLLLLYNVHYLLLCGDRNLTG